MKRYWYAISCAALALALSSNAHANLTRTCFYTDVSYGTPSPSVPFFSSGAVVDIYYSTLNAVTDYRPWVATGMTEAQFAAATVKAVGIWNEQSGARLRLRYKGPHPGTALTCDQGLGQQCAVVIIGEQMNDDVACAGLDLTAGAFVGLDSAHRFRQGMIQFFRRNDAGLGCHVLPWTADTSGYGLDVVRTLVHELGHSVFAMGHQDEPSTTHDCTKYTPSGNTILSVMNVPFSSGDGRNLKAWDKEVAQTRYGSRAATAELFKAAHVPLSTWNAGKVTGSTAIHPLFRPLSMSQGPSTQQTTWVEASSTINAFGTGAPYTAGYGWGLWGAYTNYVQTNSPAAIASSSSSTATNLLFVYKRPSPALDYYATDQEQICWQTSSNFGTSWGSQACSPFELSSVHGITAAYNSAANVFLIPFVDSIGYTFNVKVLVVSLAGAVVSTSSLNVKTAMQPAIACKQGTNTCLLVYATDNVSGSMSWTTLTINTSTYAVTKSSPQTSTVAMDTTPGLAYDMDIGTYRLARGEKASAIYSYKLVNSPWSGTSWNGTGDIYNNSGGASQISGAALSTRYRSPLNTKPYGWFVKYF